MATLKRNEQKALLLAAAGQLLDDEPIATEYVFLGLPDEELVILRDRAGELSVQPFLYWSLDPGAWREMRDKLDHELASRGQAKTQRRRSLT